MNKLSDKDIRGKIREQWMKNGNLSLDQTIIEQTVKDLDLTMCPVCRGALSLEDNFGTSLIAPNTTKMEKYCPKDNYIIELTAHQYLGSGMGTTLSMRILTNSKHYEVLAESGELADISKHVNLF